MKSHFRTGLLGLALSLLTVTASAEPISLEDWRIVRLNIPDQAALSQALEVAEPLSCRVGVGVMDFYLPPEDMPRLEALGIEFAVMHDNIQQLVDAEKAQMQLARGGSWFSTYQTYADIDAYVDTLVALNPAIATRFNVGTSLQGNEIFGIKITGNADPKPQVLLNACQHAREWIAPAITMYTADQLIRQYGIDPEITNLVDQVEFHLVPVVNPDGYIYSHTTFRLWRKNRRNNGDGTFGVDLNRNWDMQWGGTGSSGSTNSDIYRGPSPASEPETQALSAYMQTLPRFRGHLDIHNFAQAFLGPWGFSTTITPPRADELILVHNQMAARMQSVNGVFYDAGLGTDVILSPAAGICPDWVTDNTSALAWTLESRDTGAFGFELPANQIIPTGEETLEGILELAHHVIRTLEFTFPTPLPAGGTPDTPTPVSTEVLEFNLQKYVNGSGTLYTRIGSSGAFTAQSLTGTVANLSGTLPAAPCGSTVEYYFEAQTAGGQIVRSPEDAPASLYTLPVSQFGTIVDDDFETDMGWTVSGNASDGQWSRGTPVGGGDRADPPTDADGSGQCWLTDNVDGNSDVDGGTTTLTSPVFDASDGGVISYQYWSDDGPGSFISDFLSVDVATNAAGDNWTNIRTYNTPSASWRSDTIDIDSEIGATATLRVRFNAADLGDASLIECGVDDFSIVTPQPCPPGDCDGDVTGDNAVDFDDLNAVLGNWGTMNPAGDANGDGNVDFEDLNLVLGAWATTCP